MLNSEVPCVRYLIGRIVKTYDYINRVVLTLPLSVYEGTWTHSPLSLLCIIMILRVRRNFFEITTKPNTRSNPSADVSGAALSPAKAKVVIPAQEIITLRIAPKTTTIPSSKI